MARPGERSSYEEAGFGRGASRNTVGGGNANVGRGGGYERGTDYSSPTAGSRAYGPAGSVSEAGRQATRNIESAFEDYRDTGNTGLENIGNFLASTFGFRERNPLKDRAFDPYTQSQANYGFSPLGAIAGLAGTALGVPGLGTAVGLLDDYVLGRPADINLGANPLGPSAPSTGALGSNTANLSPGTRGALYALLNRA